MKLWAGGGKPWNWTTTTLVTCLGIKIEDLAELIDHGATVLILSRGMQLVLQTAPESLEWLRKNAVTNHILETREAVRLYNELAAKNVAVGGLFHSTC